MTSSARSFSVSPRSPLPPCRLLRQQALAKHHQGSEVPSKLPRQTLIAEHLFSLPRGGIEDWKLVDCRHGIALFENWGKHECIIWDPITRAFSHIEVPLEFNNGKIENCHWVVLCDDNTEGHVHGCCHWSPRKVALVATYEHEGVAVVIASVYSGKTGRWGDLLSTVGILLETTMSGSPSALVGKTLYWFIDYAGIYIQLDLDTQRLAVMGISLSRYIPQNHNFIRLEDGSIGLATLTRLNTKRVFEI